MPKCPVQALVSSPDDGSEVAGAARGILVGIAGVTRAPSHRVRYLRLWRSSWALILTVGLALKALQSPLYYFGYGEDDELFVRMAKGLLNGHWSSSWAATGTVTLAKPIGYPLFLAGAHFLPWTPIVTVYGLYLVGVTLIAWSWWRISSSRAQATVVLAALTFHPIWFSTASLRIYRDSLINALATVAIGLAFVIAARIRSLTADRAGQRTLEGTNRGHSHTRHRTGRFRLAVPYLLAVAIGLAIGMVMITKPTWQWLLVAVAAPLAYPLVRMLRPGRHRWKAALAMLIAGALICSGAYGVVATTKAMNSRTYHVALVDDLSSGAFVRAWGAWARVKAGPRQSDVAITESMRQAVYAVSPAAAQLRPYLESPTDFWKSVDCTSPLRICNDSGPWFEWDLRFAMGSLTGVRAVEDLQVHFTRLADEIDAACTSGHLQCASSPVLAPGLPTLDKIPAADVVSYAFSGLRQMIRANLPMSPNLGPRVNPADFAYWHSVVPGMSSITTIQRGTTPAWVSSVLRTITALFGLANLALLAVMVLGPSAWVAQRLRRRPRTREADWWAGTSSFLFFASASMGIVALAVFAAAVGGLGFTNQIYWADFATPTELCLVLGAFASWPVLRGTSTRTATTRRSTDSTSAGGGLNEDRVLASAPSDDPGQLG